MKVSRYLTTKLEDLLCDRANDSSTIEATTELCEPSTCKCHSFIKKEFQEDETHVMTHSSKLNISNRLRTLLSKGARYRLFEDLRSISQEIMNSIDEYIIQYFMDEKFTPLSKFLKNAIKKQIGKLPQIDIVDEFKQVEKEVKKLREHLVFTNIDKTTHDIAVCCKKYYTHKLSEQVNSNSVYLTIPEEQREPIMKNIESINKKHKFRHPITYHTYMVIQRCTRFHLNSDS